MLLFDDSFNDCFKFLSADELRTVRSSEISYNGCGQADVAGFKVRKFQFNCMLIRIPDDRGECLPAIALARC